MRLRSGMALILLALSGCGVGTVVNVVTAPVRLTGKAIDVATTSQSEADQNRGRKLRKLEARYGKLERDYRTESARCAEGREQSCAGRDAIAAELEAIRPQLPVQPD